MSDGYKADSNCPCMVCWIAEKHLGEYTVWNLNRLMQNPSLAWKPMEALDPNPLIDYDNSWAE